MYTNNYFNNGERTFVFESVLGRKSSQAQVFEEFDGKSMCDEFLKGRNCNYIVYGPTSTGKTHTMQGPIMEDGGAKINVKSIIKKAMEA